MLFRVVRACEAGETMLGYNWIEVLAIHPVATEKLVRDDGDRWIHEVVYVVRTEHGIHHIHENDLMPELEGKRYVEAPALVYDPDHDTLKQIVDTCQNGLAVQYIVEGWNDEQGEAE